MDDDNYIIADEEELDKTFNEISLSGISVTGLNEALGEEEFPEEVVAKKKKKG